MAAASSSPKSKAERPVWRQFLRRAAGEEARKAGRSFPRPKLLKRERLRMLMAALMVEREAGAAAAAAAEREVEVVLRVARGKKIERKR